MTIKIQHKRSAVKGKAPQPADLEYGEIAVNYEASDPSLYVKDTNNAVRQLGASPWVKNGTTLSPRTAGDKAVSSDVSFTQAGANAKVRTVESKLRDIVNVKDFGAVGDGVANDAAKIQAAIDAVHAVGGGTVYIPSGTYYIDTTSIYCRYAGISIQGDGISTILKTSAAMTAPALYWGDGSTTPRPEGFVLSRICIDGNSSTSASAHGISTWASLGTIRDCKIINCGGTGLYLHQSWTLWMEFNHIYGCSSGVYVGQECNNVTIFNNEINWCKGDGIVINGGHGVRVQNNGIEECDGYGLHVKGNPASAIRELVYEGNYHERNGKGATSQREIYVDKGSAEISNVTIRNNYLTNDQTAPTRDVEMKNLDSGLIEGNYLNGLNLLPGYLPVPTINQEIATTIHSDNASYASHMMMTPTSGVTFFGRLASFSVASQEGPPSARTNLFRVSGRASASPYPSLEYGPVGHSFGTSAPAAGASTAGSIVWNVSPVAGGHVGWVCVAGGTPGTWKTFGTISS